MDDAGKMTREEAIDVLHELWITKYGETPECKVRQAIDMAIKALEQDPYDFAKWVATEIFDDNWEYNKDAFEELACRKLAKLGIVRAKGDKWELVEPQESEE